MLTLYSKKLYIICKFRLIASTSKRKCFSITFSECPSVQIIRALYYYGDALAAVKMESLLRLLITSTTADIGKLMLYLHICI